MQPRGQARERGPGRSGRRREPPDAGARVHVPDEGHGNAGEEGDLRRLRRRAARLAA